MVKRFIILNCIVTLGIIKLNAQDISHVGLLPKISYTQTLNERFNFNTTFFSEIDPWENSVGSENFPAKVLNLTFVGNLSYKLNQNNLLTGGYLFRIIEPFESQARLEHRVIQQYIHIQHFGSVRVRHHLRSEVRFIESSLENGQFKGFSRLSYTLGWDVPLQGRLLDPNEFYLNSVSSYFIQPTKPRTALHNLTEFYLGLGYKTKKSGRFEFGPEAKIGVRNSNKDLNVLVFMDFIWFPDF